MTVREPFAEAHCSDGPFGELADVVVDPVERCVTHLVVEPSNGHRDARLVSVELIAPADEDETVIRIRLTSDQVGDLPAVEQFGYLRFGDLPIRDPDWDVGIRTVLVSPAYASGRLADGPLDLSPRVPPRRRGHRVRREVAVPIGAVTRLATDSVTVDLTKGEVDALPSVQAGETSRLVPMWAKASRRTPPVA